MTPKLYTTSWGSLWQRSKLGELDVTPVRISLGKPKYWSEAGRFPAVDLLMPEGYLFSLTGSEFRFAYRDRLDKIGVDRIRAAIERVPTDRPLALACFEDVHAGQSCHRRAFAEWWQEQTGKTIAELPALDPSDGVPPEAHAQMTLDVGGLS